MAPDATNSSPKAPASSTARAWEALTPPLAEWILDAVASMGFKRMTPVQASTIPLFTASKDVVVEVCIPSWNSAGVLKSSRQSLAQAKLWPT